MTDTNGHDRQTKYLHDRIAQLQADLVDVTAENQRLRQQLERLDSKSRRPTPNPLAGGQ
jgi:hypothetical protein